MKIKTFEREGLKNQVTTIDEFVALIQNWYKNNTKINPDFPIGFKDMFDSAVSGVNPIPSGTDPSVIYNWQNATIDTLCSFFKEWYAWNPDLTTGLEYIQKFSWLYFENEAGLVFVGNDSGREMTYQFVELNGAKMDSSESLPLVKKWEAEIGSGMDDYIIPAGGYKNFNEFFKRELKDGMRPISSPQDSSVLVSPADAVVNMIEDNLTLDTKLQVKTQKLDIKQLLNNSPLADRFVGGTALSCILMPDVYHRYHSPIDGNVVEANEDVVGNYFGIKDFPELIHGGNVGYGYDYSVFEHFRRGYMIIETKEYGHIAMIPVGLNTIASVIFKDEYKNLPTGSNVPIKKGDEVGWFQYGGSLNILLFEEGVFPSVRIPQGQMLGTLNKKASNSTKTEFTF